MSDADRNRAARIVARHIYGPGGATAVCHHGDLLAAVIALDGALEGTAGSLPGTAGQSLAARLNQTLPEPAISNLSTSEKALLFGIMAGVKYGWITSGGD
jgi:hypothetical protein